MSNIYYTYKHCSKNDFDNEKSFREEDFSESLEKCFETHIKVERVNVDFALEDHQENPRLTCTIEVISPDVDIDVKETGFEHSKVVRTAIKKTVEAVRKAKEKDKHKNY